MINGDAGPSSETVIPAPEQPEKMTQNNNSIIAPNYITPTNLPPWHHYYNYMAQYPYAYHLASVSQCPQGTAHGLEPYQTIPGYNIYQPAAASVLQQHGTANNAHLLQQMAQQTLQIAPYAGQQPPTAYTGQVQHPIQPVRYMPYPYSHYYRLPTGIPPNGRAARRKSSLTDRQKPKASSKGICAIVRPIAFERHSPPQKRAGFPNKLRLDDPKPGTNKANNLGLLAAVA